MIRLLARFFLVVLLISGLGFAAASRQVVAQNKQATAETSYEIPADEDLPGAGPMRRYDWFQNVWNRRRSTFENNRVENQGAVVFLGDSITQGWKEDFSGALPGLKKANRGISGDTTRGMLYRLHDDVIRLDPSAVVMLMGTNDLEEGARPKTIAGNVERILDKLAKHDSELPVILCEVFPSSASKKRPADQIQEINRLYRELSRDRPQVTVVDTWTLFADSKGDAKSAEFPDLLHPNAAGYAKWEAAIKPVLATLGLIETEAEPFEIEADATALFNGKDLTGWCYRPTTAAMRKSRSRWIPKANGAVFGRWSMNAWTLMARKPHRTDDTSPSLDDWS